MSLFQQALDGETIPRPPIWFMRQAGRYLPEYRAVRRSASFMQLCKDPDLICEVMLQPLRRFGLDAAIVFSDIMTPLEGMGVDLAFAPGPIVGNPVRTRADVEAIRPLDPETDNPWPMEAIRRFRTMTDVPVLGFAGAPFTLACYLVQGRGSKDWGGRPWPRVRALMESDPETFTLLLDKLSVAVGDLMQAQIEAGAIAVQLFDSWAGFLTDGEFERFALPSALAALDRVKGPRIHFAKGASLERMRSSCAEVIGVGHEDEMADARRVLGDRVLQGNLSPDALLHDPPEVIREKVRAIIQGAGPTGHIFNLGHGIDKDTPISGVQAMVDAVKEWSWT